MRWACVICATMVPLPRITMPGPSSAFNRRIAPTMSFLISVVLAQPALSSVRENTILPSLFICSATAGIASAAAGVVQKPAIMS
ncbi:hypothetical protein D3C83_142430 [compost metagenome]